jgi:predicted AAA+ superfamily ATPase
MSEKLIDIRSLQLDELIAYFEQAGEKAYRAKQVYEWLWKKQAISFDEMTNLSISLREMLHKNFIIRAVVVSDHQISSDRTIKNAFKLYGFDVGLIRKLSKLSPAAFIEGNRLFSEFKGALIENYILQSLKTQFEDTPRYWSSGNTAEIDFIIQNDNEIIPIEVKSDENTKSRSLTLYQSKFEPTLRIRYSLKNLQFRDGMLNIPHFLADYTTQLIQWCK